MLPHPGPSRPGWLEGYLVKRSGFAVQEWKVRWVELNLVSGLMHYFEHSRCSVNGDRPTGQIDLRATGRARLTRIKSLSDCHGMAFAFELLNDKERLQCIAIK